MKFLIPLFTLITSLLLVSCSATSVQTVPAKLGTQSTRTEFLSVVNLNGPIKFQKHVAATWAVPLSGLLNLKHPKAVSANLEDRQETIELFVYTLQHPQFGTYLIDSGVSQDLENIEDNSQFSFIVKKAMNLGALKVSMTTETLVDQFQGIQGVLLTHVHMDHIMGIGDIDSRVPVYIGPGDASSKSLQHAVTRGTTNRLIANISELQEWQYGDEGLIDVFGDGSLWAISSPGHTPGTTAYLVRSTNGHQLILGDVSHTRWGWDNVVGPGSYSLDTVQGAESLKRLKRLAAENPRIKAHPGHQN